MKITLELDQETFEKLAAMMTFFKKTSREDMIIEIIKFGFSHFSVEIEDIKQGHCKNEEYQKILELYENDVP